MRKIWMSIFLNVRAELKYGKFRKGELFTENKTSWLICVLISSQPHFNSKKYIWPFSNY